MRKAEQNSTTHVALDTDVKLLVHMQCIKHNMHAVLSIRHLTVDANTRNSNEFSYDIHT